MEYTEGRGGTGGLEAASYVSRTDISVMRTHTQMNMLSERRASHGNPSHMTRCFQELRLRLITLLFLWGLLS